MRGALEKVSPDSCERELRRLGRCDSLLESELRSDMVQVGQKALGPEPGFLEVSTKS